MAFDEIRNHITASGGPAFAAALPDTVIQAVLDLGDAAVEHPLNSLIKQMQSDPAPTQLQVNEASVRRIERWLTTPEGSAWMGWWRSKLDVLGGIDARSALAEIRAMGSLLSTTDSFTGGLDVFPVPVGSGQTPDFRVRRTGSDDVFVEVCCPDTNGDERARQRASRALVERLTEVGLKTARERHSPTATSTSRLTCSGETSVTLADGTSESVKVSVYVVSPRRPDGLALPFAMSVTTTSAIGTPAERGAVHTIASRLAGKKLPGQVPAGAAGILWMDLSEGDWSIGVDGCLPTTRLWVGMAFASTPGIWHSFYGRKGLTPMFERAPVATSIGESEAFVRQAFDGRLRGDEGRSWSAAVLACRDGVVIFEHPDPAVPLPFDVLRELVALEDYAPHASFHRFAANDHDGLRRRLDDVESALGFFVL